ncbi:nucleotide pyrophosphohydrolase [Acetivibrio clariflavus]|uniref:Putative pyrophosphatase n=1 Tax=Acetivibrio clariflavus (strain DSM 19732 / NBRC 101661 / EBR45) TaxID=720554 RepID=G8LZH1_ACECE|nr:nucleotide pyrophosphohydrolase [Acetivibrio clariflavus]AEV66834.1 putative pyrophosphatase [Acetivibrio clariflavus DSM 19732]
MNNIDLTQAVEALIKFRSERDWSKFHTPKNLSMSIAIEASELMEHFQWKNEDEVNQYLSIPENLEKVKEEIADILSYLLLLSTDLKIDLNRTLLDKIQKNSEKYPVSKCKGKSAKYNEL